MLSRYNDDCLFQIISFGSFSQLLFFVTLDLLPFVIYDLNVIKLMSTLGNHLIAASFMQYYSWISVLQEAATGTKHRIKAVE